MSAHKQKVEKKHERPIPPFADVHAEDGKLRVTLLHDPKVDGLDAALYLDSSGSMADEFKYDKTEPGTGEKVKTKRQVPVPKVTKKVLERGFIRKLFGLPAKEVEETKLEYKEVEEETTVNPKLTNEVEPQARRLLAYLASKDRNGKLRVAYWSDRVEVVAELSEEDAKTHKFAGALFGGTSLAPAIRDYVQYLKNEKKNGAKRGLMVIMTDGELGDEKEVISELEKIGKQINNGELPPTAFLIVGVGSGVKEEQLERLSHHEYDGIDHMVCHKIAEEIDNVAEVASTLVDESMTVAKSGKIFDENMKLVKDYPDRLPAVLEFPLPKDHKNFTLEMDGKKYTQRVPDEEHHDDELETAEHH